MSWWKSVPRQFSCRWANGAHHDMAVVERSSACGAQPKGSAHIRQPGDCERDLWHLGTGAPRRGVPEKYGKWMTVYQRFRRWSEVGVREAVASTLTRAMADNGHDSIDSTTVRGDVSAAGAKRGLANRLLAARGAGSPVTFIERTAGGQTDRRFRPSCSESGLTRGPIRAGCSHNADQGSQYISIAFGRRRPALECQSPVNYE